MARQEPPFTLETVTDHYDIRTYGAVLVAAVKKDGVHTTGGPVFARFDSPFIPWFLRRNEIWMEVAS